MSDFSKAFAAAKKAGKKQFVFNGRTYGTQLKDEIKTPQMITINRKDLMEGMSPQISYIPIKQKIGSSTLIPKLEIVTDTGRRMSLAQAQKITDESGEVGGAWIIDDNGNTVSRIGKELHGRDLPQGYYDNATAPVVGFGLPAVTVVGHRTHIKEGKNPDGSDRASGYIRVKNVQGTNNPVWQNIQTREYYMVDPDSEEIIGSSSDEAVINDPTLWTRYHTGLNGDVNQAWDSFENNRGALRTAVDRQARENQELTAPFHYVLDQQGNVIGTNGNLSQHQVNYGIQNARNNAASAATALANYPNHLVMGAIKAAVNPDYTWSQYAPTWDPRYAVQADAQVYGLGDVIGTEDPVLNQTLNLANTYTGASLISGINPGELKVGNKPIKPVTIITKTQPRGVRGTNARVGTISEGMGTGYRGGFGPNGRGIGGRFGTQYGWRINNYSNPQQTITIKGPDTQPILYTTPSTYTTQPFIYDPMYLMGYRQFGNTVSEIPYSVEYEPGNSNPYLDELFTNGIISTNDKYGGGSGYDVRQNGNVQVNYSSGTRDNSRSVGRKSRNTDTISNIQSVGNSNTSNK